MLAISYVGVLDFRDAGIPTRQHLNMPAISYADILYCRIAYMPAYRHAGN